MITVAHLDEQRGLRGGEQQAAWLVRELANLGVRNLLVGRPNEAFLAMHFERNDLLRIALPLRGELDLYSAFRVACIVHKYRVDIIHAHTSHAHGIAALAGLFGTSCRVVVSRRVNFQPKDHMLNRWKYRRADRILCVSQAVYDTLARFGLYRSQLRTVHSAVDSERALMSPVSRASLGLPADGIFIFSAGALVDHKDHTNLLKAFVLVRRSFSNAQLCIAGDGPLHGALKSQCAALGLETSVHFLGYRADAPGITRSADLYVSSSWSEGLGTSILEALAAGTPVVATAAGGAREMVIPDSTGYLVPVREANLLAQAIIHSLENRDKAFQMAMQGKKHVEDLFSVTRMVTKTLENYMELVSDVPLG